MATANFGKFKDRSPVICAAGKPTGDPLKKDENVASILKQYNLVDQIDALKHNAQIWKEDVFVPPKQLPPIKNVAFQGINTQVAALMNPPLKTRYQELIDNLKETVYTSYWKKQDGKGRDQVPGLPLGMDIVNTTFGDPSNKDTSLKELVNPPKTPYQVMWDSQVGHDMYKKTHNDYNPSERVSRGYNELFVPSRRFGAKTNYDPRGVWVRCACEWHIREPVVHASKIQADYWDRVKPRLGKVLAPNRNIDCVPKDHTFGTKSIRELFGVEELVKDPNCYPCVFKMDFYKWLSALNQFRINMKEKYKKGFNFDDFYKKALYYDQKKTGLLPVNTFYKLCSCDRISFSQDVESLFKILNIIVKDQIRYKEFIDLMNANKPYVEVVKFNEIPKESQYYVTTNQAASCDYLIINNAELPTAGVPSIRYDLARPVKPADGTRADQANLGDFTSVNALVSPSIYSSYGLTYRDFFLPRPPEVIRTLFEKIGYTFPGDTFDKLWKEGLEKDQTGLVCVDTFKHLLNTNCPPPSIAIDGPECQEK